MSDFNYEADYFNYEGDYLNSDVDRPKTYATRQEAIDREITDSIDAGDAHSEDYDLDAIADEVIDRDEDGRYYVKADFDAFWAAVAKHDKGSK